MGKIFELTAKLLTERKHSKIWHRLSMIIACLVVFNTTYSMILPALTFDDVTASEEPGFDLGDAEVEQEAVPVEDVSYNENEVLEEEPIQNDSNYTEDYTGDYTEDYTDNYTVETGSTDSGELFTEEAQVAIPAADTTEVYDDSTVYTEEAGFAPEDNGEFTDFPETEGPETILTYEDAEVRMTASFEDPTYEIPAGLTLKVNPVAYGSETFEALNAGANERLTEIGNYVISYSAYYDIWFELNGETVLPAPNVRLEAQYKNRDLGETGVKLFSYNYDGNAITLHDDVTWGVYGDTDPTWPWRSSFTFHTYGGDVTGHTIVGLMNTDVTEEAAEGEEETVEEETAASEEEAEAVIEDVAAEEAVPEEAQIEEPVIESEEFFEEDDIEVVEEDVIPTEETADDELAEDEAVEEETSADETTAEETEEAETEETAEDETATDETSDETDSEEASLYKEGQIEYYGSDYVVELDVPEAAHIPADAELKVGEIDPESEEYKTYYDQAMAAIKEEGRDVAEGFGRFFDIRFEKDGVEIEPNPIARISVKITFNQTVDRQAETENAEVGEVQGVHFTEKGVEDVKVEAQGEAGTVDEITFEASSFSVYGFVYTVDFETVDGGTFSIQGEGSYKLNDLLGYIINKEGVVSDATIDLIEGEEIAGALYLTQDENKDWWINSDVAFKNTYLLTMTVDGVKYEVKVTDAGSVDLTTISTTEVTYTNSEQATEVSRDASISFKLNYHINGHNNIEAAKAADEWVYDLSSLIGTDSSHPFSSLAEGDTGAIHDDYGTFVGTYRVANGKIVLKITNDSFWTDPNTQAQKTEVNGYVIFNIQLNENHNYNKESEIIPFPGGVNVPITYETKTLGSTKGVGTTEGSYSHTTDSSEVQMVKNPDGTYSLYYEVSATPNVNFKTLSITDTLGGGQSLDPSSVQLSVGGGSWQNVSVSQTGTGFTFDVAANQGGSVQGGQTYKIRYKTTVTKTMVENKTVQTNRASWNWDLGTNQDNTSVKPKFDKDVTVGKTAGTVEGTYNLGNWADANVVANPDGSATIYYDVTVKSNTDELTSLTVTDAMMGSGSVQVYKGTTSLGTATATNGTVDLLAFLTGKGGVETNAEYHLRYSTTIQPKEDGTFDNVNNKARIVYDNTPKETEITIKPKIDKTITSTKTVKGNGNEQTSGNIVVQQGNNEDFYRLHYKLNVTPGTGSTTLSVNDSISAGQEYIPGTFYLGFNDEHNTWQSFEITPAINGNSFNFDLAAFLRTKGYSVTAKTNYQITYDTKIASSQIGSSQTNTSQWTWDHDDPDPDTTDVTPGVNDKIEKTAKHDGVDVGNDQQHLYVEPGDIVDFTVVVGLDEAGNPRDMAGRRIYDEISNYGTLEGDVTITPAVGGTTTLSGSTLDGTADGTTKKVYDFTFPTDGTYIAPNGYTITYHIKISENSELTGRKQLLNKAFVDQLHDETKTPIEYGTAATTSKSFADWNDDEQKIYWYIDVEVPAGKTLHNLYVTDYHMQYGTNTDNNGWLENAANLSFDTNDITVSWLDGSVTDPVPSFTLKNDATTPNDATVNTKGIFFTELSHSVRIRVATISPVEFDSLTYYYAFNKAYVHSDEGEIGKPQDTTERYVAREYKFKKTGTYNQADNVATWTVEINKGHLEVIPDFTPYFTDIIPANMELIGNTIHVDAFIENPSNPVPYGGKDFEVNVIDNVIQPVDIGALQPSWGSNGYKKISKNHYTVTYTTRIKDEYLQQIQNANILTEQKFTNFAKLQDENGDVKKTDDDTVEYKYDNLIDKTSGTLILGEYIPYTVEINPQGKVLNSNQPYTATDVISTDVNLYIGNLDGTTYPYVVDANGNNLLDSGEASISYNDDTRELSVTVPDGRKVTFVFAVNAIESGTHTFENTVVLDAEVSDDDTDTNTYTIVKSEAGIQGVDVYVSLKKIDRNNPLKGLPGAKFKLVKVNTPGIPRKSDGKPASYHTYEDSDGETQYVADGDGTFGTEEEVGIFSTVGTSGGLNFTNFDPYQVYYWVETEPAPGYIMTNTEKHYFVAYPIVRNNAEATTDNQRNVWAIDNLASSANNVTIVSARSGYSWNVTNLKEETVTGHFEGIKTLQGRDMEKDEFTFSVEAVSARVTKVIQETEQEVDLTTAEMPMPASSTVKNPAGTKDTEVGFAFGDMEFHYPGTYTYKIKETAGSDNTISYDQTEYTAEVTISRDPDSGDLQNPVITYKKADGSTITKPAFINTLKSGSLSITKAINPAADASMASDKIFTFEVELKNADNTAYTGKVKVQDRTRTTAEEVTATGGKITVTVTGTGTATLSEIPAGTKYEVTEPVRSPADGWVQDGTVTYGDSAKTIAANDTDTAKVTNKYEASGKTTFDGTKTIKNRNFKDGDTLSVSIESTDTDKLPDPATMTVELNTDGTANTANFSFAEVTYTYDDIKGSTATPKSKTFHYTVTESATMAGTTADTRTHTIEVIVTDNGNGTLDVVKAYKAGSASEDKTSFENTYNATGTATFNAKKILKGKKLVANAYEFELLDSNNSVLATGTNDAEGNVTFNYTANYQLSQLTNGSADFTYKIREKLDETGATSANNYTVTSGNNTTVYDGHVATVTVHVTDNGSGDLQVSKTSDDTTTTGKDATFTNTEYTKVEVDKKWLQGTTDITDQITNASLKVTLSADGWDGKDVDGKAVTTTVTLPANNSWSTSWDKLPKENASGTAYTYVVTESEVKVSGDTLTAAAPVTVGSDGKAEIDNTLPTTEQTVTKAWTTTWPEDVASVQATISATGTETDIATLIAASNGAKTAKVDLTSEDASKTWNNLPVYDNAGNKITYSVSETSVTMTDGTVYTSESTVPMSSVFTTTSAVDGTTTTITNTEKTTKVPVDKTWAFADPSTVNSVDATDGTTKKWPEDVEVTVQLYKTVNGTESPVTGKTVTLNSAKTADEFKDLPLYDGMNEISYSVKEASVTGVDSSKFTTSVSGNAATGYTISNTEKEAGLTIIKSFTGATLTKTEKDAITFTVTGPGLETAGITKTYADFDSYGQWKLTQADGIQAGQTYTIVETNADIGKYERTTTIKVNEGTETTAENEITADVLVAADTGIGTINVTNAYTKEKTEISGTKTWVDKRTHNNANEIVLKLYRKVKDADDSTYAEVAANEYEFSWVENTYKFTKLDKYVSNDDDVSTTDDEKLYVYKVEEESVTVTDGDNTIKYSSESNGNNFINTELTEISAKKTWSDEDAWKAGMSVTFTVEQYKDETKQGDFATTAAANTNATSVTISEQKTVKWENLPKYYLEGTEVKEYTYKVSETAVSYKVAGAEQATDISNFREAYTVTGEGTATDGLVTINNTPKTTERHANKIWDDNNDENSRRPGSVTFTLKAFVDGTTELTATEMAAEGITTTSQWAAQQVTSADWSKVIDWTALPEYTKAGKLITYDVVESPVTYYSQTGKEFSEDTKTFTFTNKVGIAPVTINAKKFMKGGETPGEYDFTLEALDRAPMPTKADKSGREESPLTVHNSGTSIEFEPINFTLEDMKNATDDGYEATKTFRYKIKETPRDDEGVIYSTAEYTASIVVTYNASTGELVAAAPTYTVKATPTSTAESAQEIVFINTEVVEIDATKTWKNGNDEINATITNATVKFELQSGTDGTTWEKVTKDASDADLTNPVEVEVAEANAEAWKANWENLPKYEDGNLIQYKVVETYAKVADEELVNDESETKPEQEVAFDDTDHPNKGTAPAIENTLPTTEQEGTKTWIASGTHDNAKDITLKLTRTDGTTTEIAVEDGNTSEMTFKTALEDGDKYITPSWTDDNYKYDNLPLYSNAGVKYEYSVEEVQFKTGSGADEVTYTVTKDGEDYIVTSDPETAPKFTVTPTGNGFVNKELTEFEFEKVWEVIDAAVEWPEGKSIKIELSREADGVTQKTGKITIQKDTEEVEVTFGSGTDAETYKIKRTSTAENIYKYELTDLSKFKDDDVDKPWTYKIIEEQVEGYNKPKYFTMVSGEETEQHPADGVFVAAGDTDGVRIVNDEVTVSLPETGGRGTLPFKVSGSILLAFSALMYVTSFRRRQQEALARAGGYFEGDAQREAMRGGGSHR